MLTEQQFRDELRVFVEKMNENRLDWQLKKNGKYARQTHHVCLPDGRIASADSYIIYNSTYQVPTLWFNFFEKNGTPIPTAIVEKEILKIPESELDSIRTRISYYEHPFLGVLYYNIHPCHTSDVMKELRIGDGTYMMTWLSIYGQQIGLKLPDLVELLKK